MCTSCLGWIVLLMLNLMNKWVWFGKDILEGKCLAKWREVGNLLRRRPVRNPRMRRLTGFKGPVVEYFESFKCKARVLTSSLSSTVPTWVRHWFSSGEVATVRFSQPGPNSTWNASLILFRHSLQTTIFSYNSSLCGRFLYNMNELDFKSRVEQRREDTAQLTSGHISLRFPE